MKYNESNSMKFLVLKLISYAILTELIGFRLIYSIDICLSICLFKTLFNKLMLFLFWTFKVTVENVKTRIISTENKQIDV